MSEMRNWGLGLLDDMGEAWFIEQHGIEAVLLAPDKPINQTTVSLVANFNTGHKRYLVYVVYDPRAGEGSIRLSVEPFESVK